jgi:hypothetical protein
VKADVLPTPIEKTNDRCLAIDLSNFGIEVFFSMQALLKNRGHVLITKIGEAGESDKPGQPV